MQTSHYQTTQSNSPTDQPRSSTDQKAPFWKKLKLRGQEYFNWLWILILLIYISSSAVHSLINNYQGQKSIPADPLMAQGPITNHPLIVSKTKLQSSHVTQQALDRRLNYFHVSNTPYSPPIMYSKEYMESWEKELKETLGDGFIAQGLIDAVIVINYTQRGQRRAKHERELLEEALRGHLGAEQIDPTVYYTDTINKDLQKLYQYIEQKYATVGLENKMATIDTLNEKKHIR